MVRAVEWREEPRPHVRLIDQTALPTQEIYLEITRVEELVEAIQRLAVRGAPALGAAGGYGVALADRLAREEGWTAEQRNDAITRLREARPTAVNLAWAVDRVLARSSEGSDAILAEAERIVAEDLEANRRLSALGADWILETTGRDQVRVVTHCNTGALATSAWGTGYGIIRELHERGRLETVYVDETRPLLQGSRLTSWELTKDGIDHRVQVDGAAPSTILRGLVDVAIIGADRITADGDTANKIGSVSLALACQYAGVPFVVAAPSSTVDLATSTGDDIVIEERGAEEVLRLNGEPIAPPGVRAFNPAFDVTPHDLISAIITEKGVVEPTQAQPGRAMSHALH